MSTLTTELNGVPIAIAASAVDSAADRPVSAIEITNLVVKFGDFTAVNDVTISVEPGEVFAFLGPNGAGKSTTIQTLIGSLKPTSGTVQVAGHGFPEDLDRAKPLFGYIPDTDDHIEEFTGRENLRLFAELYGVREEARINETLSCLELSEAGDVAVKNYSKGMKRKLLIAREILHRPQILFLDEPTANLDLHSTQLVRGLLRDVAAQGTTVFLTTHDMLEVEEICDRAAILCRGSLVACDTPASFIAQNSESRVAVQYELQGIAHRESFNLENDDERDELACIIRNGRDVRVRSEDFHFEDVFLKITGQAYN